MEDDFSTTTDTESWHEESALISSVIESLYSENSIDLLFDDNIDDKFKIYMYKFYYKRRLSSAIKLCLIFVFVVLFLL